MKKYCKRMTLRLFSAMLFFNSVFSTAAFAAEDDIATAALIEDNAASEASSYEESADPASDETSVGEEEPDNTDPGEENEGREVSENASSADGSFEEYDDESEAASEEISEASLEDASVEASSEDLSDELLAGEEDESVLLGADPYSGSCGAKITWSYDEETKCLSFVGEGAMNNYSSSNLPDWHIYSGVVQSYYFDPRINEIGDYAFYNMGDFRYGAGGKGLINLPKKLKRIGKNAFSEDCFYSVVMPEEVEVIDDSAFYKTSIKTSNTGFSFPKGVRRIGDNAFYLASLRDSNIRLESIEYIGNHGLSFFNSFNLTLDCNFPASFKYLGDEAISGMDAAGGKLTLPEDMEYVGDRAFADMKNLTGDVTFPKALTRIGAFVLGGTAVNSVTFGPNIKKVDFRAFEGKPSFDRVSFLGNFPEFEGNNMGKKVFSTLEKKLIVYYPFDNDSWSEGLKHLDYNSEFVEFIPAGETTTVSFADMNGKVIDTRKVVPMEKLAAPSMTTVNGKKIGGWYTSRTVQYEGTKWNFDDPVKSKMTLYAGEVYSDHRVVFFPGNGENPTVKSVKDGEKVGEITPKYEGYRFRGWLNNGQSYYFNRPVHSDLTLRAVWEIFKPQVTFDCSEFGHIMNSTYEVGDTFIPWALPISGDEAKYYELLGWYFDKEYKKPVPANYKVTKDVTVYPKWRLRTDLLTLRYCISLDKSTTYNIERKQCTKETFYDAFDDLCRSHSELQYYEFDGWFYDDAFTKTVLPNDVIVDDLYFYGKVHLKTHAVTIDPNNGEPKYTVTVKHGSNADVSVPVKKGYEFEGWSKVGEKSSASSSDKISNVTEDAYYKATWIPEEYKQNLVISGVRNMVYTGSAVTLPDLKITDGTTALESDRDYTVRYSNNTKAGEASATITYKGKYTGKTVLNFSIYKANLGTLKNDGLGTITSSYESMYLPYNRKVQKVKPKITYIVNGKKKTLQENKDYKLIFVKGDNKSADYDPDAFKEPGNYTVKVVGMGGFEGDFALKEIITEDKLVSKLSVSGLKKSYSYTGSEIYPVFAVSDGKNVIGEYKENEKGEMVFVSDHLSCKVTSNKEVGTADVVISARNNSGYAGTKNLTFNITGTPLSKAAFDGFKNSFDYTGSQLKQEDVKLYKNAAFMKNKDKSGLLSSGTDYSVSYSDNTVDVGKVTVTYTGKGGYTGVVKKTYTIKGKSISKAVVSGIVGATYNGKEIKQEGLTVLDPVTKQSLAGVEATAYDKLKESDKRKYDYTVSYENNVNKGTAKVIIEGVNGYQGRITRTFRIDACNLAEGFKLSLAKTTYYTKKNGCRPDHITVSGKVDGKEIFPVSGKDYTVVFSDTKNFSHKATVTVTGKGNYFGKLKTTYWVDRGSIADQGCSKVIDFPAYSDKVGNFVCKIALYDRDGTRLTEGVDYIKEFYHGNFCDLDPKKDKVTIGTQITIAIRGINGFIGTYYANGTLEQTAYRQGTYESPVPLTSCKFSMARDYTYTGKEIEPSIANIIGRDKNGNILDGSDFEVAGYENNINIGTGTVILKGKGNFTGTFKLKFRILPRAVDSGTAKLK